MEKYTVRMPEEATLNNSLKAAALEYARRGWPVFPLHWMENGTCSCGNHDCSREAKHPYSKLAPNGFKDAICDPAVISRWWDEVPFAGIGIQTGVNSGLVVVDVDGESGRVSVANRELPETPTARSGRIDGGTHYWYQHPGGDVKSKTILPGVETRADGGYIIAAPTVHKSGNAYEWIKPPGSVPFARAPQWVIDLATGPAKPVDKDGAFADTATYITEGRNNHLTVKAGHLRRQGLGEEAMLVSLDDINRRKCHPPLPHDEIVHIVEQAMKWQPGDDADMTHRAVSDLIAEVERTGDPGLVYAKMDLLGALGPQEFPPIKQRLKSVLGDKLNLNDLTKARTDARRRGASRVRLDTGKRIVTVYDQDLADAVEPSVEELAKANDPEILFTRGGVVVRVREEDGELPVIVPVTTAWLEMRLSRLVSYTSPNSTGADKKLFIPRRIAEAVLAMEDHRFPRLNGIVQTPVVRPDGTILDTPGYDPATKLVYLPAPDLEIGAIPAAPTPNDLDRARAILDEALGAFVYAGEADRANAYAAALTPVVRQVYRSNTPALVVDAVQRGTGKTKLASVIGMVALGEEPDAASAPMDKDEWRKRITTVLQDAPAFVLIDNVRYPIDSPELEAMLTSEYWSDRRLGVNEKLRLRQTALWAFTGNNVRLKGDLARRHFRCRLDKRKYEERGGKFPHPDILFWARHHRGDILWALLTLTRAWFAAGQPKAVVSDFPSFQPWAETVGGILAHAGIEGFLGNLADHYRDPESEDSHWDEFFVEWHRVTGSMSLTVKELKTVVAANADLKDALPKKLLDAMGLNEYGPSGSNRSAGKLLKGKDGWVVATEGLYFEQDAEDGKGNARWRVTKMDAEPPETKDKGPKGSKSGGAPRKPRGGRPPSEPGGQPTGQGLPSLASLDHGDSPDLRPKDTPLGDSGGQGVCVLRPPAGKNDPGKLAKLGNPRVPVDDGGLTLRDFFGGSPTGPPAYRPRTGTRRGFRDAEAEWGEEPEDGS